MDWLARRLALTCQQASPWQTRIDSNHRQLFVDMSQIDFAPAARSIPAPRFHRRLVS